jgi:Chaperone of endosialidase
MNRTRNLFLVMGMLLMLASAVPAQAAALFYPGQTLDPNCLPSNSDCTVSSIWTGVGLNAYFNTGNLGIGSSTPSARLSVAGSGTTTGIAFQITNSANVPKFTVLDNGGITAVGTSTFPKLRNGEVALVHANGSIDYVFATTSSDVGRGNALLAASGQSVSGDTIYVAPGTFDIGDNMIDLSKGGYGSVSIQGSGKYSTVINGHLSGGFIIKAGYGTNTSDLSMIATNVGAYQFPWGTNDGNGIWDASLRNVYIRGYTDGVYFSTFGEITNVVLDNVSVLTGWDALVAYPGSNGGSMIIKNSDITTEIDANLRTPRRALSIATNADPFIVDVYDSKISSDQFAISADLSEATVNVYGGRLVGAVQNVDSVAVVNIASNVDMNPALTSGTITYTNTGMVAARLGAYSGNVGVGTTTPASKLSVSGSIQSTGLLGGVTTLSADANGNIIRTPSDQTLKENVVSLSPTDSLGKLLQLRGVSYDWKDKDRFGSARQIGFIAQEVEPIVPEVVTSGGTYKSLNYGNLTAIIVEAIKALNEKIEGKVGVSGVSPTPAANAPLNGIQMIDQVTGEAYCVTIKNGDFSKDIGACVTP